MSRICELCGKKPVSGNNVSHSKRRTKRLFSPNLITKRFGGVKKTICAACLRTLQKAPRVKKVAEETAEVAPVVEAPKVEKKEKAASKPAKKESSSSKK